ncbi:MAG: tripartite tricarboxylate transporter substrate binding protein [Firmicutes bacterium]|nr:tripartite tricarboxylate transporter substrate binding protein [Bacillota bacterium]
MKSWKKILVLCVVVVVVAGIYLAWSPGDAKYPAKAVQLLIPYSTGGGTDSLGRLVAAELEKYWNQPVVVVNKPGAASQIGTTELANAKNDGYTIGMLSNYDYILTLLTSDDVAYSYDDFEYVASINTTSNILVANSGSEFKSLEDLIAYAKKNPGKLTVAVSGKTHVAEIIMLEKAAGIDLTPIMYSSGGESLNAVLGGHVDLGLFDKKFHEQTAPKGCTTLGLFGEERLAVIKDIPTLKELGYDVATETYRIFTVPKGVPQEIAEEIANALKKVSETAEFQDKLTKLNEIYKYRSGKELQDLIQDNFDRMKEVVDSNPQDF